MRFSKYTIPISIFIHLVLINGVLSIFIPDTFLNIWAIIYFNTSWLLSTYWLNFYPTSRKERFWDKFHSFLQLLVVFGLAYFAWFGFKRADITASSSLFFTLGVIYICFLVYRISFFWARSSYREMGGNQVNVVVIGRDRNLKKIRSVFDEEDLGYRYKGYFDNQYSQSPTYLGKIEECFQFILNNNVDQIFCTVSRLSQAELLNLMAFADNNMKKLKIIPDNKEVFTRAMTIEMYRSVPVLNMRELPLDTLWAHVTKRIFDIAFSLLVIVGILSWLSPFIFILQRFDSNEPLYFKQKRHGVERKTFWCYKFRSMTTTPDAHKTMISKNDKRVTKLGRILRRTSIDELPQFFNVLLGDMSVVGPRPHMELHTEMYQSSVDKYLVRHFVKPGITGLAQIKGYRGEIIEQSDIVNRTRLDIFYVEKWSLRLDIKIVIKTVINAIQGEEKAY
ncbi:exopolysaccharide biosynthesis polyprenyl glycosylphosphotransferase [Leeuwenhoekiella sp. LLG6367-2.1]|uniref:exopolysaccharide biosynthesis polyprenyl glycosylphosphotransferase n=1 Tax=Leeuwenhoekiella sp. LLG6367-2.1 TaxID=3160833 RepID=UPI00386ECC73